MASMWRKAMLYLGLGPDEEYEDDALHDEAVQPVAAREAVTRPPARPRPASAPTRPAVQPRPQPQAQTRPHAQSRPQPELAEPEPSSVRTLTPQVAPEEPSPAAGTSRPVVRPVPASSSSKPHVVSPGSFNHAQEVADKFKANQPVIVNLQGAPRDLARRLIDFSSGLCYGLGGHMEKVAHQVYLLTPSNVEVPPEERRRLQERGLHDA